MPRLIRQTTRSLPAVISASLFGDTFAAYKAETGPPVPNLSAMALSSNQPPFHIINGVAYPCETSIPIDRVISFIAAARRSSPFEINDGPPH